MATRRTFLLGTGGAAAAGLVSVPALAEPRVERGGRPDPDLGRFTIAVIPDTQYLFDRDRGDSAPLDASLRYLLDHAASDNIVFISHLGDLTENGLKSEIEDIGRSFRVLDRRRVGYSVLAGNHDLDPRTDDQRGRTPYLDEFGPHRFRQSPTFRGASADGYNSFHVFKAAGREWLVLALDWRMSAKGFDWARDVLAKHPTLPVVLTTHELVHADDAGQAAFSGYGRRLWDELIKDNDQVFLTIQRPLLAARPRRHAQRGVQRRARAHHELPGPLLRRQRDDPALPLRPGARRHRRAHVLAVAARQEVDERVGACGDRAHR
ncbi:metallophosphoesterase [Saccharothrix sp.]|uniref:metallophosphoesterase n=1 Tax=Saccharothrix sp. TaxID=1873460 RepID=UPI002812080A|nr:metallophosphoesterase [Saccharothrix sp.]